jgi:hypothetical protein
LYKSGEFEAAAPHDHFAPFRSFSLLITKITAKQPTKATTINDDAGHYQANHK